MKGWERTGKLAILLQPLIVAGLIIERAPSLTAAALSHNPSAAVISWLIAGLSSYSLLAWTYRMIRRDRTFLFRLMPEVLQLLGAAMGVNAAIAATGNVYSWTLVVGYTASSLILFDGAVHAAHERRDLRKVGPLHA